MLRNFRYKRLPTSVAIAVPITNTPTNISKRGARAITMKQARAKVQNRLTFHTVAPLSARVA